MVCLVWGFLIWSLWIPKRTTNAWNGLWIFCKHTHMCIFLGTGSKVSILFTKLPSPQSNWLYINLKPYTTTEANKLRDTRVFWIQPWLWGNGPAPLPAAIWRRALLVACWVNATLCLQNNVALSEWCITWKSGWVPDLLQYCHILMGCCNLTPKPAGRESGFSLNFLWICPSRFQRNPSQVQVSHWQFLRRRP